MHAPSLWLPSHSPRCSVSFSKSTSVSSSMAASGRIAIIGDVHDDWNLEEDTKALQLLQPDLVLFTGDFGDENVELVPSVADLNFPKAVIFGNHDAWKTQHFSGKRTNGVQLQLERLGDDHVAYKCRDFPTLKVSVVGGLPFSCGGDQLFRRQLLSARKTVSDRLEYVAIQDQWRDFYRQQLTSVTLKSYGVEDMDRSATRICNAALGALEDHFVILLAHNGPTGLGSNLNDICGKDRFSGAETMAIQAISFLKETTRITIPLVVFGHMHKQLAYGNGLREMIVVGDDKIIYLNGAVVPRVHRLITEREASNERLVSSETSPSVTGSKGTLRAFTLVDVIEGKVDRIVETWVSVIGDETTVQEEEILYKCDS